MNTYKKYCTNVFVAQCEEKHEKGAIITLTTKYGKENKHIVHNLVGYTGTKENPLYLYSITRCDGLNSQEIAKRKADKLRVYAENSENRSLEAYKKADLSEEATGIPFGQPILVGHHSERKHRKVLEKADNAMRKAIEEESKADQYQSRAEYWESKADTINLSMPESLGYYEYKLKEAKELHQFYKENPEKREHSYSLTYANKKVKEMQKNVELAIKLWGEEEEVKQIEKEKEENEKSKLQKNNNFDNVIKEYGGFFFFGSDTKAFREEYNELLKAGCINEGDKVCHIGVGLYVPAKHKEKFKELLK